jgi:DNA-directed RNA polymerase subunit E'/Rpb7|tara:strand:+ start:166 stop:636 length:471 start_codon:yes stop_codon:yes gene_type:complete
MQTSYITRRVVLHPQQLTKKINKGIKKQLVLDTKNECTKQYGYILKINKIQEIIDNEDTVLNVKFSAQTLKPEINKTLKGEVYKIYKDGIFIDVLKKQKILVPSTNLTDYTFDEENNIYTHNSISDKKIKENDIFDVKIEAVKYSNGKFSCFGSLA